MKRRRFSGRRGATSLPKAKLRWVGFALRANRIKRNKIQRTPTERRPYPRQKTRTPRSDVPTQGKIEMGRVRAPREPNETKKIQRTPRSDVPTQGKRRGRRGATSLPKTEMQRTPRSDVPTQDKRRGRRRSDVPTQGAPTSYLPLPNLRRSCWLRFLTPEGFSS